MWREFRSSKRVVVTISSTCVGRRVEVDPQLRNHNPPPTSPVDSSQRNVVSALIPLPIEATVVPTGAGTMETDVEPPPPTPPPVCSPDRPANDRDFLAKGWCSCPRCQIFLGTLPDDKRCGLIGYHVTAGEDTMMQGRRVTSMPPDLVAGGRERLHHELDCTSPPSRKRPSGVIRCVEMLTLRCPLSWRPVAIPVRFAACAHSGVFDLVPFVHQQLNRLDHYQFNDFLQILCAPEGREANDATRDAEGSLFDITWRCPCCGDAQSPLRWVAAASEANMQQTYASPLLVVDAEILTLICTTQQHQATNNGVPPKALVIWRGASTCDDTDGLSWKVRH